MKIAIINGPNLNLLGTREPEVYGSETFEKYFKTLEKMFPEVEFSCFQSNVEGDIINELHRVGPGYDGVLLNAGGYTHTSVAIRDAIAGIRAPIAMRIVAGTRLLRRPRTSATTAPGRDATRLTGNAMTASARFAARRATEPVARS